MVSQTTPRLRLVPIEERHWVGLRELWMNPDVMRNVGFPRGLDPADLHPEDYVATPPRTASSMPRGRGRGIYMAVETKSGDFLGEAKLGAPDPSGVCEPDVKILPPWWGEGYGEEITRALVTETFALWPECVKVRFTPSTGNQRAQRLYAKLGARCVGDGYAPPEMLPLRGFAGVRYLVLEIDRRNWADPAKAGRD